ncbi:MAG: ImmA/IrrE family metallo-endopeptidase [Gemmatimonadota bacterium]|nr:ImmA/IrrE family metallo-endopeptidase [Gemmatimonadota bacterium]
MEFLKEDDMATMKLIKTEVEYEAALADIEALVDCDPEEGSPDAERLGVLVLLVEDFESKQFPPGPPDPVEAIRFRMEQQGLSQRDLVPFLGSRSKVSEVLSGKRELTLSMIRALHKGLGIPADALLHEGEVSLAAENDVEWERFPLREMAARGWIKATASDIRDRAEELVRGFLAPLGTKALEPALFRKTSHVRSARTMDPYALKAWTAHVLLRARENPPLGNYVSGSITPEFMQELARLSTAEDGPRLAQDFLGRHGISLIIEPHLPRTHLDGAALVDEETGTRVIGLSLRHDRIDNFWFCLMHEMAHVARHLEQEEASFYDDLEVESQDDPREAEADAVAGEALIPEAAWQQSTARVFPAPEAAQDLAARLGIHPAIVAGRIQYEAKNFKLLHQLVGRGEVRALFRKVTTV